ncbi:hypothetical protein A2154_01640 [Candidatus Gottesmanbacteria bacterium RBG_16_43_7]|uniref:Uncharacterized protein n=1 Tax=Candidatus Gottesmanbacteria bacterium RBG_16_43_7 TaxID=1798373 RepID=A0A1F5ZCC9_9BACT|nr:MAG: hypothetical protein A2154_01640 [Candidatus Gottesmanbacteria bacterium RBG_16_43_7]
MAILATDGLISGLYTCLLISVSPFLVIYSPIFLILILAFDLMIFMLPTIIWTSWKLRTGKFIRFLPHFYLMRIITSLVFLESFFRFIISFNHKLSWSRTNRYDVNI